MKGQDQDRLTATATRTTEQITKQTQDAMENYFGGFKRPCQGFRGITRI